MDATPDNNTRHQQLQPHIDARRNEIPHMYYLHILIGPTHASAAEEEEDEEEEDEAISANLDWLRTLAWWEMS